MRVLEERRTRLSLAVWPLSPTAPLRGPVHFRVKGQPQAPISHRLGYQLFLDLPSGAHTLLWSADRYEDGQQSVTPDALPRLRPRIEVPLTLLAPLTITLTTLGRGTVGRAYRKFVTVTGGKAPFRFRSTPLPAGLTLDEWSGVIAGVPTTAGRTEVTVGVTDRNGTATQKIYTLTVLQGT